MDKYIVLASIDQQVVRCSSMIDVTSVDAVDHETAGEAEAGHYFHGVLVYSICHEIFCQRAVVAVCHFFIRLRRSSLLLRTPSVVEILYIHKVDISVLVAST